MLRVAPVARLNLHAEVRAGEVLDRPSVGVPVAAFGGRRERRRGVA